jgi:hypothetical protein
MEIELGKTYDYFDDGKINESRRLPVKITNITPFKEIDKDTLNEWQKEVEQCDWLYAKETDYFVFGELKIAEDSLGHESFERAVFVRTINNGWFSLGFWAGRLDVDGKLKESLD